MKDELDEPGAVAQVDEHQPAVIAAAMDPPGKAGLRIDAVGEHLAAPGIAVLVGPQRGELERHPDSSFTALARSSSRCSPVCMSRTCAPPPSSRITVTKAPL